VTNPTVDSMARFLRDLKIDLNNERAVMRTLARLHFEQGDIFVYSDEAVKLARGDQPAPARASILGDGIIMIAAAAVWLAWYCVLSPVS